MSDIPKGAATVRQSSSKGAGVPSGSASAGIRRVWVSIKNRLNILRLIAVSVVASIIPLAVPIATGTSSATTPPTGTKVVGQSNLGGMGLNGHVAVLGNFAYVGFGTNGGFAAQWNKTPTCAPTTSTPPPGTVKVVSLVNPATPTVVANILVGDGHTLARDVAAIHVNGSPTIPGAFTGDLLAIALESCDNSPTGLVGVNFYNITNPLSPVFLGKDDRTVLDGDVAVRQVSLVQRPSDGRVFAFEAAQGGSGGVQVVDVSRPTVPITVSSFLQSQFPVFSQQECRPFNYTQGVSTNAAGSKAYVAQSDEGLYVLDTANPPPNPDPTNNTNTVVPPTLSHTTYPAADEGNSFRFVPNAAETNAVATDEDLLPAKTALTISTGSASTVTEPGATGPGVFRGCEAIWGSPLYKRSTPSLANKQVTFLSDGGCLIPAGTDLTDKIALVDRGGTPTTPGGTCGFEDKAKAAQALGAVAVLVGNSASDHHAGGSGVLFSPDSSSSVDAGVTIPIATITQEARNAMETAIVTNGEIVTGTLADSADTWGALRVFGLSGAPSQVSTFNAPHTNVLTPGDGLYHAVNSIWEGNQALVAWMSDGLRVVDLTNPAAPVGRASFVPPSAIDPTGNYGTVPLVVSVAKFGSRFVVTDINGGLYVLNVALTSAQCTSGGWKQFDFANASDCMNFFN